MWRWVKTGGLLTTAVLPLAIQYTVVVQRRSSVDGVVGLGGLTVQAHCQSRNSSNETPKRASVLQWRFNWNG